jgi:flagellar protein FliL
MAKKKSGDEAASAEGASPAPNKKKKLIMVGGAVAVLLAAAGGGWFFFMKPKADGHEQVAMAGAGTAGPGAVIDLEEMKISLAAASGEDRQAFLKLKVALEVADEEVAKMVTPLVPRVVDNFQVFMRELRPADLEGSAGLYRLKEEMIRRVNVAVYPHKVDAILFRELLVQ